LYMVWRPKRYANGLLIFLFWSLNPNNDPTSDIAEEKHTVI
jgi:hypothetical protein